jgi:hypothetical protein
LALAVGCAPPTPALAGPASGGPPDTTITNGPSGTVTARTATFAFSASQSKSTFECQLDSEPWASCTSPKTYPLLADQSHTFSVRSRNSAGEVDPTPAARSWTVDGPSATLAFVKGLEVWASDGQSTWRVSPECADPSVCGYAHPALSPDGEWLAYGDNSEWGGERLWVSKVDGSDRRHLLDDATWVADWPVFTPDGRHVLGTSYNWVPMPEPQSGAEFRTARLFSLDGSNSTVVGLENDRMPALDWNRPDLSFTADGRLAYNAFTWGVGTQLYFDGSIYPGAAGPISPDGTRVSIDMGGRVGTRRINESEYTWLTSPPEDEADKLPVWSPEGTSVIYIRYRWDRHGTLTRSQIREVATDGTYDRVLLEVPNAYVSQVAARQAPEPPFSSEARRFRPILLFDTSEKWRPLNVDRFAGERDDNDAPIHLVCQAQPPAGPDCQPFGSLDDLALHHDSSSYIDVAGDGTDEASYRTTDPSCLLGDLYDCDSGPASAIYYHAVEEEAYTYLDYWFLYRYNDVIDLPGTEGLTHEGDWEGVTVVPSLADPDTFDFVSFAQHNGAPYAYLRSNLRCDYGGEFSCGEANALSGARVHAYVAQGTHATYAEPCSRDIVIDCTQSNSAIPEGGHDGTREWGNNSGDPALTVRPFPGMSLAAPGATAWDGATGPWTTWPGSWGVQQVVASPGNQARYQHPWEFQCADDGCAASLTATASRRVGASRRVAARRSGRYAACPAWGGPGVSLVICRSTVLKKAMRRGRVSPRRPVRTTRRGKRIQNIAAARGIVQAMGRPLQPRQSVTIERRIPAGARLMVLIGDRDRRAHAWFNGLDKIPARSRIRVLERGETLTALLTRPSGHTRVADRVIPISRGHRAAPHGTGRQSSRRSARSTRYRAGRTQQPVAATAMRPR